MLPTPPERSARTREPGTDPTAQRSGTLTYDLAGNLTQDGTQTNTWNARGQMTATSAGSSSLSYDAFGRRSSSTISGTTRAYVYDGWNIVQEKDGSGAVFANSIFGLGLDDVFWRKPVAGSASNYISDILGSTVALLDSSGASTTTYTYEPYGKPTAGDLSNPFTFTGRESDSTLGLQLNRARYYSPSRGRFASEDPIGEAGGLNLYQYADGSPTAQTDPLGLDPRKREPFDFTPVVNNYSSTDPSACLAGAIGGAAGIVAGGELLEGVASVFGATAWLGTVFPVIGAVVLAAVGVGFIAAGVYAIAKSCS